MSALHSPLLMTHARTPSPLISLSPALASASWVHPSAQTGFCEAFILDRIAKMQRVLGRLGDLENSQVQTTLLRSYLSLLKPYRIVCLLSSRKLPVYLTTGSREPGRHLWGTVARLRPTFPTNCGGRIFVLQFCMPQLLIPAQSQSLLT